jgi:hypothetical protein
MFVLNNHYLSVVHSTGWTGNPGQQHFVESIAPLVVSSLADEGKRDHRSFPPSWVGEIPVRAETRSSPPFDTLRHRRLMEAHHHWHSLLTGIYSTSPAARDFWFPGGTLADAAPNVLLRPRPVTTIKHH